MSDAPKVMIRCEGSKFMDSEGRVYNTPDATIEVVFGDDTLTVQVTSEGLIYDTFAGGEHTGTQAVMFDDLFDDLDGTMQRLPSAPSGLHLVTPTTDHPTTQEEA